MMGSSAFRSNILSIYGVKGQQWLEELPTTVNQLALKFGLYDLKPVLNLSYNYVLSGFQGNHPIILKLGLDELALKREAVALKCFSGCGAVGVLAQDDGVLLLQRAVPGISLKHYFPKQGTESLEIACRVMKKLHRASIPEGHNFPHVKNWLVILDEEWALPTDYLQKARKLRDRFLCSSESEVLLHGDLHHDNILQEDGDWVVIDPKGVIGWPINEVWAFILDLQRDIPWVARYFNFKVQDVFDWYFIHVMLAACWNLEDKLDPIYFLEKAEGAYRHVSDI